MTRAEKIAWAWVWSAIAVASLIAAFAAWHYWGLPQAYLSSLQCHSTVIENARPSCDRVLSYEHATADMRIGAHLRLANMAKQSHDHRTAVDHYTSLISLGQATANDWNERGLSYYSLRQYDKAAEDFQQAAVMNGAEGIYWSNLADAQIETRKYAEALQNYTTAIEKGNDGAEVLGNRGWANYQLGDYTNALADYDKAIAQDPQHADNFNERGVLRHASGDYDGALADYDRSLSLKPNTPIVLTNRAVTHAKIGNTEKAGQDLDQAIGLDPNYSAAHLEKAWLLIDTGQPDKALAELKEVERLAPPDIFFLEARGRARYNQGLREEAIADAEQAMALDNQVTWPYQLRSEARQDLYDYEGSIADATIILKRDPTNIDALVTRSTSLQLSGHLDAALVGMEHAIKASPNPAYAYEQRSYLNIYAGRLAEAVSDAKQSVALAPQSVDASTALGWAYIERGTPSAALLECNRALSIKETERALRCRAIARLQLNRPKEALADANRAIAVNSISPNNHIVLGRIELAQGNPDGAIARFDTALKLHAFDRAAVHMYHGDAEKARGNIERARSDYLTARKFDLGLYRKALDERISALPGQ